MQVELQASTIHLFGAAQAPDATKASLALQDNRATTEGRRASEGSRAEDELSEWEEDIIYKWIKKPEERYST